MTAFEESIVAPADDGGVSVTLALMIRGTSAVRIEAGEPLVRQGEQSETAFVIAEGTVRVVADTAYGPVSLATLSAPKLIGEIGALSGQPRTASIVAVTPLTVYVVPRSRLMEVGRENPQFFVSIIGQLGRQIEGTNRTLSLYSNALPALEKREFDPRILDDLANPSPQLAEFSAAFREFAQEIVTKRRQQDELASAAIIQQSFLPRRTALAPAEGAIDLSAKMRPARHMGGDLYDYFFIDDSRLAIVVGDVCGKGIPAGLFLAVVMTTLRLSALEESNASAAIARTNALLCRDNPTVMFATVFYGVLDIRNGTLEYCNCGHNAPLVLDAAGNITTLPATGLPLGVYPDFSATAHTISLSPEDLLVLFTDGVTEAMNTVDEEFTDERLQETLLAARNLGTEEIVDRVFHEVDGFAQGAEQADDITCFVLRRLPPGKAS